MRANLILTAKCLLLTIALFFSYNTQAQVTIGSGKGPVAGALLDLKEYDINDPESISGSTASKGFNAPRVRLTDSDKLFPMFDSMNATTYQKDGVSYTKSDEDSKHVGLLVYNLTVDPTEGFVEGFYYWNGQKWIILVSANPASKFFYMPSFVLNTSAPYNTNKTVNLYDAYKSQFTSIPSNRRNPQSKVDIPTFEADQLDYYITGFDDSVLEIIEITDAGVLTYQTKTSATSITYINVVFVIK